MAKSKDPSPPAAPRNSSSSSSSGSSNKPNTPTPAASDHQHQHQHQHHHHHHHHPQQHQQHQQPGSDAPWAFSQGMLMGAEVRVEMANQMTVHGRVMAFDPDYKTLVVKTPSQGKRGHGLQDVNVLNLSLASDVKVISEAKDNRATNGAHFEPADLSTHLLRKRIQKNIEVKKRLIKAYKSGISPEGHALFQSISKTIDEIDWKGDVICVSLNTTISPPYRPENVKGNAEKEVAHIRKLVEKHFEDRAPNGSNNTSFDSSSDRNTATGGHHHQSPQQQQQSGGNKRQSQSKSSSSGNNNSSNSYNNNNSSNSSSRSSPSSAGGRGGRP